MRLGKRNVQRVCVKDLHMLYEILMQAQPDLLQHDVKNNVFIMVRGNQEVHFSPRFKRGSQTVTIQVHGDQIGWITGQIKNNAPSDIKVNQEINTGLGPQGPAKLVVDYFGATIIFIRKT